MAMRAAGISRQIEAWFRSLPGRPPPAVVTGSSVNALSFARSLGRRGVPVLILDSDRHLGVHTRYARVIRLPPVEDAPQDWIDVLDAIGRGLEAPGALFCTSDRQAVLLSEEQDRLRPSFRFLTSAAAVVRLLVDKRAQYEFAERAGISVPVSRYPESLDEVRQLAAEVAYPCILKPYRSQTGGEPLEGRKLLVVRSATELVESYRSFEESCVPVMVQEIIPGGDDKLVGYLGLWNEGGQEVAWITKRKLRQSPPGYGNGSLQKTEELPEIADLSRRLLRSVDYRGFASVEFKYDEGRQRACLIEINPRSSAVNQLAVYAGVDFPWIGYQLLTGRGSGNPPVHTFRSGVTCVNEEWEVRAFVALHRSGDITLSKWLRSLRRSRVAVGAWDDPMPLVMGLVRAFIWLLRTVRKAIGGERTHRRY